MTTAGLGSATKMLIVANSGKRCCGEGRRHCITAGTTCPSYTPVSHSTGVRIKQGNMFTGCKTRLGTLLSKNGLINFSKKDLINVNYC